VPLERTSSVMSGLSRDVADICALLGHYAASNGRSSLDLVALEDGTDTSVKVYHSTLRNTPEERRSQNFSCSAGGSVIPTYVI
jgi:hypothetical protein